MNESRAGTNLARVADRAGRWLGGVRGWFIMGTILSALGFALPWFRVSRSYSWYYGGWGMLTTNEPGLWWISLIFLGYAVLIAAGFWLNRLETISIGLLAALAIGVALATLVVVSLAAADAVNDLGRVYRIDLNIGLFVMLPAHGLMIVAALAGLALQLVRELLQESGATLPAAERDGTARAVDPATGS